MEENKNILWQLFKVFFRIGLFTIGGGYAMLPMLQREVIEKHKWATEEEIMDYYAIGQSTPGIIAINTATFIGFKEKGVIGGIIATLGMVVPSWFIIISIAAFFQHFADNPWIQKAFAGIRVVVVVLILNAVIKMGKKAIKDWIGMIIGIIAFIIVVFLHLSPIYVIINAGAIGILLNALRMRGKQI
ncbi:chromate transporter [Paramaledivibacter caminithermalis]|jgi:chromate transporter|uniref:Chromate transporter n=1 Tax=Paramaledivibacter caminithermalis (strain DSM 15212 / CIP 107654 / DViRD3) TaxID=1121301 RepID=A0A1M6QYX8_PARC5|nr:chromate transporter [Paramaledivibacter caminithermalis]SHK25360.1 chromate transporter [Paramaledivibacter caminithermalis DSM 15212]